MKQVLVVGLGNFGYTLAINLASRKCDVLAVDIDKDKVQSIKNEVSQAICADVSDRDFFSDLGVKDVDIAVISLGSKIDLSIMVTLYLKELGVKRIMTKSVSDDHAKVLRSVGATDIVFPEKDEAIRLAQSIASADILEFIRLSEDYSVVEIAAPKNFIAKSLKDLQIRTRYKVEVLGIRNVLKGKMRIVPPPDYVIEPDDTLIVVGEHDKIEKIKG